MVTKPAGKAAVKKKPVVRASRAGAVVMAVRRDLAELERRRHGLATCALAALALSLAREVDAPRNSATSKSMCAGRLLDALAALAALAPAEAEDDGIDELTRRRAERRAAVSR